MYNLDYCNLRYNNDRMDLAFPDNTSDSRGFFEDHIASFYSEPDEFDLIAYIHLLHDIGAVAIGSVGANRHEISDFRRGIAFGNQLKNFPFTGR